MSSELKKLENSQVEIITTIEGEELEKAKEKSLKKLCSKVSIKGFRAGKVPFNIAKDHVSPMDLANETINESLNPAYLRVVKENNVVPIASPEVNIIEYNDKFIKVSFKITTYPEVTLGKYKGLDLKEAKISVKEEEIEHEIKHLLEDNAELVLKESAAEMGDTVIFDFKGYINGKEFDGGSANNYSLVLGSNQFVPGFEEQLVGVLPESKKDVIITFPEQYIKDLAGKEAKFVCMIHEIKTKNIPELNDEFVKSLSLNDVNDVKGLKAYQKNQIKIRKENDEKGKLYNEIIEKIVSDSKVEIPPSLIQNDVKSLKDNFMNKLKEQGLTLEQYKEITGLTEEKIEESYKENATSQIKRELVLNKVASEEHLVITKEELEEYYEKIASQYNMKLEEVKKIFASNESQLATNLLNNKIMTFLLANNIKEEKKEPKNNEKKENVKE